MTLVGAPSSRKRSSSRRTLRRVMLAVIVLMLLVVAGGGGYFAGRWTLVPTLSEQAPASQPTTYVSAMSTSIGRSVPVSVKVEQEFSLLAANGLTGTVTAIAAEPPSKSGDIVYAVDGLPVRLVAGTTPFFREMSDGMVGPDITQLRAVMREWGYFGGDSDGKFTSDLRRAVLAWQKATGAELTGTVRLGELVAVSSFPVQIRLTPGVKLGARISDGDSAIEQVLGSPRFSTQLTKAQAGQVTDETAVAVQFGDQTWQARPAARLSEESGVTTFDLQGVDPGSVCGANCTELQRAGVTALQGQLQLIPALTGVGVPVVSIRQDSSGHSYVVDRKGAIITVIILGSDSGIAIVQGLTDGQEIVASPSSVTSSIQETAPTANGG